MTTKRSHRGPAGQNFNTTYPDHLTEVFVDGVGEVMLGLPNCKMTFYQTRAATTPETAETGETVEEREAVMVLTMNLGTMVETFGKILANVGQNREHVRELLEKQLGNTMALLDSLAPPLEDQRQDS